MLNRWFWLALAIIAATMAAVQILSIRQESQIWDEGFEIVGGYQYLTTGVYRALLKTLRWSGSWRRCLCWPSGPS